MEEDDRTITVHRPTGPRITVAEPISLGELVKVRIGTSISIVGRSIRSTFPLTAPLISVIVIHLAVGLLSSSIDSHFYTGPVLAGKLLLGHSQSQSYTGPCDLTQCSEAYSVTRSMTAAYSGPLFQLYNGSTTLDIGQTANHDVDMTTWSAFCSGSASNCKYSKIYAQIHTTSNDLVPSVFSAPFGPDCTGGGANKCAATFSIESATGLPIIDTTQGTTPEYTISGDADGTGVNGPGADLSFVYNGHTVHQVGGMCCGPFGIGHPYNGADVVGTDFFISVAFDQFANPVGNQCPVAGNYCIGIDEESSGDWADIGSSPMNLVAIITYKQSTNKVTASLNGTELINKTPVSTLSDTGRTIHLGGGGDLSQPAPALVREIAVTNSAISLATQINIVNNVKSYFIGSLSFP